MTEAELIAYARQHRYRIRNLHDGGPVPPARWRKPKGWPRCPKADTWYAIIGRRGYITDCGLPGILDVTLLFSSQGAKQARQAIHEAGGVITQEGDTELSGRLPDDRIGTALRLIRVYKRPPASLSLNLLAGKPPKTGP